MEAARCRPAFRAAQKRINFENLGPTSSKETSDPNPLYRDQDTPPDGHFPSSLTVEALLGKVIAIGE